MSEQLLLFREAADEIELARARYASSSCVQHPLLRPIGTTPILVVELDADGLDTEVVLQNAMLLRAEGVSRDQCC